MLRRNKEFRSTRESPRWRAAWDWSFFGASLLASFLFGVAVGNAVQGVPLGPEREFLGLTLRLLTPYLIPVGVMVVATFAMHGAIYLYLKTRTNSRSGSTAGSSAAAIAALSCLFGMAIFPNRLVSSIDPAYNLTIYNRQRGQLRDETGDHAAHCIHRHPICGPHLRR